jgi:hypothetical protein
MCAPAPDNMPLRRRIAQVYTDKDHVFSSDILVPPLITKSALLFQEEETGWKVPTKVNVSHSQRKVRKAI